MMRTTPIHYAPAQTLARDSYRRHVPNTFMIRCRWTVVENGGVDKADIDARRGNGFVYMRDMRALIAPGFRRVARVADESCVHV